MGATPSGNVSHRKTRISSETNVRIAEFQLERFLQVGDARGGWVRTQSAEINNGPLCWRVFDLSVKNFVTGLEVEKF